jgi:hypothetical protein
MKTSQVGINVSNIWKCVNSNPGSIELKTLKKKSQMHDEDFYLALSWLTRNNKIRLLKGRSKTYIVSN